MRHNAVYVSFLKTYLPRLGLRWQGFRKVHRHVTKRLKRRLRALHLPDLAAYEAYLASHPEEWRLLEQCCWISISCLYRAPDVFDTLRTDVLPRLVRCACARYAPTLRCWSAGCAAGEEVYTLTLLWHRCVLPQCPPLDLVVIGTDVDGRVLERDRSLDAPIHSRDARAPGHDALVPLTYLGRAGT